MSNTNKLSPVFKCPGGKRRLIPFILKHLPEEFDETFTYVEPFVGGGALALHLLEKNPNQKVIINDFNYHIYNLWVVVQKDPDGLMSEYDLFCKTDNISSLYSELRDSLPPLQDTVLPEYETDLAATFLFLNKNSFNGLIRYNSKGQFNAPLGKYNSIQTYNKKNLLKVSKAINNVTICNKDFETVVKDLLPIKKEKCLIYFDPPYVPLTTSSSFTAYTSTGFGAFDQHRLNGLINYLTYLNIPIMVSNSNTELVRTLYKDYNIHEVGAIRAINCKGSKRGKIKELLITNY
jgi:DNA adenine methylase